MVSDVMAKSDEDGNNPGSARREVDRDRGGQTTSEELDSAFDLLRVARRRYLLYYLTTLSDETTTVEDAVEAVIGLVDDEEDGELPPRQSVRLSLTHSHLPRLDAHDVVDYDARRGEVRVGTGEPLTELLERARRLELE
jgi:hypothetical protein